MLSRFRLVEPPTLLRAVSWLLRKAPLVEAIRLPQPAGTWPSERGPDGPVGPAAALSTTRGISSRPRSASCRGPGWRLR
eukprot:7925597-Pyramimonas_sp.AAC.1